MSSPTSDRYVVLDQLGRGGMGSVHRILDQQDGRYLALKRLHTERARNPAGLTEMFHQEFRTLARLRHPHVVEVYDFGIDAAGPYYTMEWLDGEDLQALAPLPWREVCALGRDICSALALLHSRRLIHRDPSPRNIKRLRSQRAKLIDFGGMMGMDVARNTVGTAPLVAPEVLLHQVLDARTDLYALGGTLYFALTGRHAYPVKAVAELNAMWRVRPAAPSRYVPEIPAELDHLVLAMLSLEPGARPRSAAEVLERLSVLAELAPAEQVDVPHAYISTPELFGRESELNQIRARLRELHLGQGGVLWIGGEPGVGRSRLLAAAGLEAKLAGAQVLYARGDGSTAPYGLLRELLTHAPPSEDLPLMRRVSEGEFDAELDRSCRPQLLHELREWLCSRAQRVPLVLSVDDVERSDKPSRAALAALAHDALEQRALIMVTCSIEPERVTSPALSVLLDGATRVALSPLRGEETHRLLASIFGDVPNLDALALRIHTLAEGSPRGSVELARYLVDEGLASYRLGAWRLPTPGECSSLPTSLTRARRQRLSALSETARELGAALAIADGSSLPANACLELIADTDHARARAALDELIASQILIVQHDGARYAFEAQVWLSEFSNMLAPDQKLAICRRIAIALARHGSDALEVARYQWLAGDAANLVETLLAELASGSRWDRSPREYGVMLANAAGACAELGRSKRDWYRLVRELVKVGQDLSVPGMHGHLTALFRQLELDTGLAEARTLPASLAPEERMRQAFELATRRYEETPEHARCLNPLEAIEALTWLVSEAVAFAAQTSDGRLFDSAPSLELFATLAPAVAHVQNEVVPATRALLAARYEDAKESYRRSLEFMATNDTALLDAATRSWAERVLHYALGCAEAAVGRAQALEHAAKIEQVPAWRVPAWTIRHIYYGTVGNVREADRCRKRIELLWLQSPVKPPLAAGAAHQHVYIASLCEDVTGLRECIAEMTPLASQHPTLRPFLDFARAEQARICGDAPAALEIYTELGRELRAGDYPLWSPVINSWLVTLIQLDRWEDAHRLATRSFVEAERAGITGMKHYIDLPLGLVEAKFGRHERARELMDGVIAAREADGYDGFALGWAYEWRVRLALLQRDEASFEKYAMLCRQQYKKTGGNPALAAKYERLMQDARMAGTDASGELGETLVGTTSASSIHTTIERDRDLKRELRSCPRPKERANVALSLLLERARARDGELYLLRGEGLEVAASTLAETDVTALSLARRLIEPGPETATDIASVCTVHEVAEGPRMPLLLSYRQGGSVWIAGVAVLRDERDGAPGSPLEAANAIARVLADLGDVQPRQMNVATRGG